MKKIEYSKQFIESKGIDYYEFEERAAIKQDSGISKEIAELQAYKELKERGTFFNT